MGRFFLGGGGCVVAISLYLKEGISIFIIKRSNGSHLAGVGYDLMSEAIKIDYLKVSISSQ